MKRSMSKTTRIGLSLFLLAVLLAGALSLGGTQTAKAWGPVILVDDFSTGPFNLTYPIACINFSVTEAIGGRRAVCAQNGSPFSVPSTISLTAGDGYLNMIAGDQPDYFRIGWGNEIFANPSLNLDASIHDRVVVTLSQAPSGGSINLRIRWGGSTASSSQPLMGAGDYTFLFSSFSPAITTSDIDGILLEFHNGVPAFSTLHVDLVVIRSEPCPAGQYDNGAGCVAASPGYYVPVAGATSQIPCPVGYYQPSSGSLSCIAAAPGYYVDTTGAAGQTLCPPGYTSDVAGASSCYLINTPPTSNAGGPYLGALNTAIAFDGSLSSDSEDDPLTYAWDFGDSSNGTGIMPAHSYSAAGIYTVCLTVNDGVLDSEPNCSMAVVYNPSAGFVTGGGWIDSPVNTDYQYMQTGGKATFGFVAKYKKGAIVPDGDTAFQFTAGDLDFKSTSYEWLVVSGDMAQFKGEGTIKGLGSYQFMITANDNPDTFRIKIWDDSETLYDNGSQQSLGGGSIVVHSK